MDVLYKAAKPYGIASNEVDHQKSVFLLSTKDIDHVTNKNSYSNNLGSHLYVKKEDIGDILMLSGRKRIFIILFENNMNL